jgi:phosphoribosylamine--glycine ligase
MKVLVVGGGGREHALVWRLARDPSVTDIFAAPGNAGIADVAMCHPVAVDDVAAIADLAESVDADVTVVGPEGPLVAGLADVLSARGLPVFGPSAAAARIEGSKAFAKEVMANAGVATARAGSFEDVEKAVAFVDELGGRAVVKADGLAAGKGVVVAADRAAAVGAIEACLVGRAFGEAGRIVIVEELLEGPEVSAFAFSDGSRIVPLERCQDFKRIGEGDAGPNTGGMGAYSPLGDVPGMPGSDDLVDHVFRPVVEELGSRGTPYRGVLFAGLMLTTEGPTVLEFNCRFGDPETQVLLPRIAPTIDLASVLRDCANGDLSDRDGVPYVPEVAVTVVIASGGYPGSYTTGVPIDGLADAASVEGVTVFHAGTTLDERGRVVTAGGRVLDVTALGRTLAEARGRAYAACELISFEGAQYRHDIAAVAAKREAV